MKKRAIAVLLAVSVLIGVFALPFGITGAAKQPTVKSVTLSKTAYKYNAKVITPGVVAIDTAGKKLVKGTDYKVSYSAGRKLPGKYSVKVVYMGKYKGSCVRTFVINPANISGLRIASASSTALKIQWKKRPEASGYMLQYYNTKTKKWTNYRKTNSTSTVSKNLKVFTSYKFRVRAYKSVNGKVYYGAYSVVTGTTNPPSVRAISLRNVVTDKSTTPPTAHHAIKWNKAKITVTGYQVQYGMPKGWYGDMPAKWFGKKTVKGTNKTVLNIPIDGYGDDLGMARVRTYCTKAGKTYYSAWSNIVYLPLNY